MDAILTSGSTPSLGVSMRFYPGTATASFFGTRRARHSWLRDERGAAAIEFAIVAMPFLFFVLGLLGMGLYFLTVTSLEHGVENAARKVRTGEAKKEAMTVNQFKQSVCSAAGANINCGKLSVIVQSASSWDGLTPRSCLTSNNGMVGSTGSGSDLLSKYSGGASEVVMVTLCYQWDLANTFGFLRLGKNDNGSGPAIIQAATAFKSEPYE